MSAFVVIHATIKSQEKFQEYGQAAGPTLAQFGGEFVGRGPSEALAGEDPHKLMVILKFPTKQAARDWYESDAYQAAVAIREQAMNADFILAGD